MASTVFHHFVAADNASETLAGLKRIHGLMPYFGLKTMLKISNPISMIRSGFTLFAFSSHLPFSLSYFPFFFSFFAFPATALF